MGLAVRDAVVRYGGGRHDAGLTAVDHVDLAVGTGEVVALLGPSGCGKSSLLRAVAGLEPLASGGVAWDDEDLARVPVHRRGFGLLFQDGQLFGHRDVAGNIEYGLRMAGVPAAARGPRIGELLEVVGLVGYGPRDVATLSGGERQRVALARALAPEPRLLLLDEPLSALDRGLRERLAADLRAALVATGSTALFVTHDHDEAFTVADRVAVMAAGRLLQVDAPAVLWRRPRTREVAEFLGYEAFVDPASPAGRVLAEARGAGGRLGAGTLALAPGALRVVDAGAPGALRGTVLGVTAHRGAAQVEVEVEGLGAVHATGRLGATWPVGTLVGLAPDPEAITALPDGAVVAPGVASPAPPDARV